MLPQKIQIIQKIIQKTSHQLHQNLSIMLFCRYQVLQ